MPRAVDYEAHGRGYARGRRTDPRIEARIHAALGDARTVVNVGAGTGSYEPADRWVLPIEPSAEMRAQRPVDAPPSLAGTAESLPLDDDSVDAAMACVTIHHWLDRARGLAELRRVARGPVVIFTFDLAALPEWLLDYFGRAIGDEVALFGTPEEVAAELGGTTRIERIPIPADCLDGFVEAYWNRPEALLDPEVRASQSLWQRFDESELEPMFERLAADLESGAWDERHGHLRDQRNYEGSLRLIISEPAPA